MKPAFFEEAQYVWTHLHPKNTGPQQEIDISFQKKLFDIFHVGNFYYWFFDIGKMEFRYISPEIKKVLGYEAEDMDLALFMSKIHKDDQHILLNHEETVIDFFKQLPNEKIPKYKVSYDYRMISSTGQPVRILHQVIAIQYDDDNNIMASLGVHTDIRHLKTSNKTTLSFIGLDGEPSYINVETKKTYTPTSEIFTEREKEIIHYLLKGMQSTDIAKLLYISKYTVDTHRKNILLKAGTRTTLELAIKIITEGLI